MERRGSGILLHVTSLPSSFGIGDMGPSAYRFADFLAGAKQGFWQVLPVNPTCTVYGNSPYSSFSAFAGNQHLISPELMVDDGILSAADIRCCPAFPDGKVNYRRAIIYKERLLSEAFARTRGQILFDRDFQRFCEENSYWLDDYSLFIPLKQHMNGMAWNMWPVELRDRLEASVDEWREKLRDSVLREKFLQYVFYRQWTSLKLYCEDKNIQIIGDIPIYVNLDSSDVWAHPDMFRLDHEKRPLTVTGVPPDYFSSTGQLWGHPVYDWDNLRAEGYLWWIRRIEQNLKLFHFFRLDHFRGFIAYWEVSAGEETAVNGRWTSAPARDFFNTLFRHFTYLPLIAEDLGVITPDVREVINLFGFPGMRVLLFAFGENLPVHPYAPHNHVKHCVVYTGTHDNNTVRGWFRRETTPEMRERLSQYIGRKVSARNIHWEVIRLAMGSVADMVIIPMQDILGLGERQRMNLPGTSTGNWEWRLRQEQMTPSLSERLMNITGLYGRG
jgi:4-alpha-glucanotransferase